MNGSVKLTIAKCVYTAVVFLIALAVASRIVNRSEYESGSAMSQATFPTVRMTIGDEVVNAMHGYAQEMDARNMRGPLVIAGADRTVDALVYAYGAKIEEASFETRTMDGENLIEQSPAEIVSETDADPIRVRIALKDLIEYDQEYMLVVLLKIRTLAGETRDAIRYYTRIVCSEDAESLRAPEHIAFVRQFHENTFTQPAAVRSYLETTREGRNASFTNVDIHSSYELATWDGLEIVDRTTPQIELNDLHHDTASISLRYTLTLLEDGREMRFHVVENYFTRYGTKEMYLIDYRRDMQYVFTGEKEDILGDALELSYSAENVQMVESDQGGVVAFVNEGRLYVYQIAENRLTLAFGFYEGADEDIRTAWQGADLKILQADESGNVMFSVTGYMNRGRHEGRVGTLLCGFNAQENLRQELVFLADNRSEEILRALPDTVSYVSARGVYYSIPGADLCAVDLYEGQARSLVAGVAKDAYATSTDGDLFAYQKKKETLPDTIRVMDLKTELQRKVEAETGESVFLLGFLGEDLVYGAHKNDAQGADEIGNDVYPMYKIVIQNADGVVLSVYENEERPVERITVEDNRIVLHRVRFNGQIYEATSDDQIMRTTPAEESRNRVTTVSATRGKKTRIALKTSVDAKKSKRFVALETQDEAYEPEGAWSFADRQFYCVDHREIAGIYDQAGEAVARAYALYGQVVDETNAYVYYRGNMTQKNQIMTLTNAVENKDFTGTPTLEACLSAMLEYAGVGRNVGTLLQRGMTPRQILTDALTDAKVVDLTGAPLRAVTYYVDLMCDYPVLAWIGGDNYVLIIGFNEFNVVLFDPRRAEENVYKYGIADAQELFEAHGNRFLTYVR